MLRKYSNSHHKIGAILHVWRRISARSHVPKVGSLREIVSTHIGAAISLRDLRMSPTEPTTAENRRDRNGSRTSCPSASPSPVYAKSPFTWELTDPSNCIREGRRSQATHCQVRAKRRTLSVTNGWYHRQIGSKESPFHTSQTTPTRLEH